MLENWNRALDCALFMDFSKAFDTIDHDLLLTKLKTYGFSKDELALMCSYLQNRKQKVIINNSANTAETAVAGVPQGSSDGPLLFNLKNSDYEIIIEITIDRKLTFNKHIKNLCRKAGQKLSALVRVSPYLDEN